MHIKNERIKENVAKKSILRPIAIRADSNLDGQLSGK